MIKRSKLQENYCVLPNEFLNKTTLSWAARGLGAYLLSKPADWTVSVAALVKAGNLGRDGVYGVITELETAGYLTRTMVRGEDGTFAKNDYTMADHPFTDLPLAVEPTLQSTNKKQRTEKTEQPSLLDELGEVTPPARRAKMRLPPVPADQILTLWRHYFPLKPQPVQLRGPRLRLLSERWLDGLKREYYHDQDAGLVWWDKFLAWCAENPVFSKPFFTLDFLIKPDGFDKTIEGNYRDQ